MKIKPLLAALLLSGALVGSARAADIKFTPADDHGPPLITIIGEIVDGDAKKFRALDHPPETLVMLYSPGGLIGEAMTIGEIIHARKLVTQVFKECYSACALIWVAGEKRRFNSDDKIGFHAPYATKGKKKVVSSSGSAEIGAYLNMLGLSYEFVRWATSASPTEASLFTIENSHLLGLRIWVNTDVDKKRSDALDAVDDDVFLIYYYSFGHRYCESIKQSTKQERDAIISQYRPQTKLDAKYFSDRMDRLLDITINDTNEFCKGAIAMLQDRGFGDRIVQEVHLAPTPLGIPVPKEMVQPAAPTAPAPVKPAHFDVAKFIASGNETVLWFITSVLRDCSVQSFAAARVAAKPAHGSFKFVQTEGFTSYASDSPYAKCNENKVRGVNVIYTSDPDYIGEDSGDIFVIFPNGSASEVHYTLIVR